MSDKPLALTAGGESSQLQHDEVLVNALLCLDTEYIESDRQMAMKLVEHECKTFRPTKNYLTHMPVPDYDACMLKAAVKRDDRRLCFEALYNAKSHNEHLPMRQNWS